MFAHSTLMANSLDSDGRDAAALHRSSVDTTVEASPDSHSNLLSSNGSGSFTAESAADASDNSVNSIAAPVEESCIRNGFVEESVGYEDLLYSNTEMGIERIEEHKDEGVQVNCSEKCVTEIHVFERAQLQAIDRAQLIEPSVIEDENGGERNWKEQEPKEKKPKRRGGKARRNNEKSNCYPTDLEKSNCRPTDIEKSNCYPTERREKKGLMYSREELEALRFEKLEEQKKKWVEIYCRLGSEVVDQYDGLVRLDRAREKDSIPSFDFDPRPQFQKSSTNLGEVCQKVEGVHLENLNASDPSSLPPNSDEIGSSVVEEDYCEDDDSDEEYSIQRPAFLVTGEPDFDSGPPLDGLEYLRRVRWEAARIPKVKVARVNKVKEQSLYMPQIPDVMKCPEKFLPLKEWEDSFLSDFSQLREAFAWLDLQEPTAETSVEEDFLNQMVESNTYEKFVSLESVNDSSPSEAPCILETSDAKSSPSSPEISGSKADRPTLSAILKMDSAARTSMLKKRINSMLNLDTLPYNDSLWLFALCAAIDCPLHADTSAALRSLLRKCASLRAAKTEVDDEVIVLNILVTITGRYFGQLERE